MSFDTGFDFDYAIIGSGFGGSVAALRLAQKGYSVCVIEAGKRWSAADFPPSSWQARRYFWMPRLGCHGLQRMDLLRKALVITGVGVGGGSLIYGNTLFVPLESFFDSPEIRALGGGPALMPYYDLARRMMGVVANPRLFEPDRILRETAEAYGRGESFTPSPVGVFFGEPGEAVPDPYFAGQGPDRAGCRYCGGCFIGCRYNAKNTLDLNYLYLAETLGATVIPETRVDAIRPLSEDGADGYAVHTSRSTSLFGRPKRVIRARGAIVAGGVMGTLRLLLACKQRGDLPNLSARLGHWVRTNSETLVAVSARDRSVDYSEGIAASSSVFPDAHTQVQADRYPAGSDTLALLSTVLVDGGSRIPRPLRFVGAVLRRPLDLLRHLWLFGFAKRTVILVVMQDHDNSFRIVRRRRRIWPFSHAIAARSGEGPAAPTYIPAANEFARRMARRMDGIPLSAASEVFLGIPATAHILGGCRVADSPEEGVVDPQQRAFGYRNLWVCDGSVIPANLGVNPALSILAFSERAMSFVPPKGDDPSGVRYLDVEEAWGVKDLLLREPPSSRG